MIRIVVLGSGATVPSPERNMPSVAMRYNGDVYLFDCGEGTQRQMMKYGISEIGQFYAGDMRFLGQFA